MKKELIHKLLSLGVQLKIIDGNLKVNAPKGVLDQELLEEIKNNKSYLINLIASNEAIPKTQAKKLYDLTPTQYFMWFAHEHLGGNRAYNIVASLKINGQVDAQLLEKAIQKVVERHEILRTVFKDNKKGEVHQSILSKDAVNFKLEIEQSQTLSKTRLHKRIKEKYDEVFNLEKDLLIKASLLFLGGDEYILLFVLHHIIGDGWSLEILTNEIMLTYESFIQKKELILAELPIQYKDYSDWLNKKMESPDFQKKLQYWKEQFNTLSPALELIPKKRPAVKTYNGQMYYHEFSNDFSNQLKTFSKSHHTTLFMLLFGGINGVFAKYSGQSDITLGTTVAGREHQDLESQIGLYSNALPIRTQFDAADAFIDFIQMQKQTILSAYENKEYPFTSLVSQLSIPQDLSSAPLFDVMVLLQNHKNLNISDLNNANGIQVAAYNEVDRGVSQFDISLVFVEKEEVLSLNVEYNTDIYNEVFIQNMLGHFEMFLKAGIEDPNKKINNIEIVAPHEKDKILYEFNQPIQKNEAGCTIIDLIESEARKTPNQIAIVDQNENMIYQMLQTHSNSLAALLEAQFQIKAGDFVGLETHSSAWTMVAIIALLKLGAAYVPIDPNYPKARKEYIKKDSKCKLTIDESALEIIKTQLRNYASTHINKANPKDLAYIIYTSGTTGKAKGVQITHESLVDYALTFKSYFELTPVDKVLQQASISFDTSIEEIFPILISGGTLIIHQDKSDVEALIQLCQKHEITVLSTNPYVLQYLNQGYDQYNLKTRLLISGGDVLQQHQINNLFNKVRLYNTYGPTESTVCATYHKIVSLEENIPIGKPINNRQILILEPNTVQLTPIGIAGELCISGKGLSKGYLNLPDLTKEKFIENPYDPKRAMYRTGDLGYWKPNGELVFLGRKDSQVKIRGYRIELGEITSVIQTETLVKKAVVLCKDLVGEKVLVAYLEGENIDIEAVRNKLRELLPGYMVPDFFVEVATIPLTLNGKIDERTLLSIQLESNKIREHAAPSNALELQIAAIWEKILGIVPIGTTDNFFELGGHSLKVLRLVNELKNAGQSLKVKDVFMYPTIAELAQKAVPLINEKIKRAPKQDHYPATSTQQRIWVLSQFKEGSKAYNISNVLELKGNLNISMLQKAVDLLIDRHESLRTYFTTDESGQLNQCVLPKLAAKCPIDVHAATGTDVSKLIEKHIDHAFDLSKSPLLKIAIITISENHSLLLFNLHHIIGDGWSMEILSREAIILYNLLNQGKNAMLPDLPIQYKDFAHWKNSKPQKDKQEDSKKYWLAHLSGELPALEFLTPKIRPKIKTYNGAQFKRQFSKDFTVLLKKTAEQNNATLFMLLMAGLNGLLHRYSNQNDIIIGTPVSEREHPDLENQIGLYLNTLAIRTQFQPTDTFEGLLKKQKEVLVESYAHQSYPFNDLVEALHLQRNTSRSPLFDIMAVFHNQTDIFETSQHLDDIQSAPFTGLKKTASQFDLTFSFVSKEQHLVLETTYNTDIYTQDFVETMIAHFEQFMLNGVKNFSDSIATIDYLPSKEKEKLRDQNNDTRTDYSNNVTIIDLVEAQIKKTPGAVAILVENKAITYNELYNAYANMAYYLLHEHCISPGDFVGIKLKRNEKLITTILAILKLGATYVPIDMNYPQERISYIEKDSACKLVVTEELLADFEIWNNNKTNDAVLPEITINPNDLAYLIYTSGSTGNPKGVMISHSNAAAFLNWSIIEFSETDFDVLYAATSYSFDLSVFEMFYPLCSGKKTRLLDNSLSIVDYLEKDSKIFINSVPSTLQNLLQRNVSLKNVKAINLAGEPLSTALSNALQKYPLELRNLYGPSETTTYSSCYIIDKEHPQRMPIGRPIANTYFYILSNERSLQGEGIVGEIYISGAGLSKGYLNNLALTAEKFVPNPFEPGAKMYRTGDFGYWMPDGNIGFVGREDAQIKLRGYRVELGEIEQALLKQKGIDTAVVLLKEHLNEKNIVAYATGRNLNPQDMRAELYQKLPGYMVPAFYHVLDEMPLTPNGKIDKKALLSVEDIAVKTTKYAAPQNDIERTLTEIWQKILKTDANALGTEDNFFELGGNSLQAVILINNINKAFNTKLSITDLYEALTIKEVAALLDFSIHYTKETTTATEEKDEMLL